MTVLTTKAVRDRMWRAYADTRTFVTRTGSVRAPRSVFGDVSRSDSERWTQVLADRHDAYRAAVEPVMAPVAVVCVSTRPHLLATVIADVAAQRHRDLELVLVTNDDAYADIDVDAALAPLDRASVPATTLRRAATDSLGTCLNVGMDATSARFIAKFDDDDRYGPEYLTDALRAHTYAGVGVVGKHTYYAHVVEHDCTVLRFPTHEFRYSSTLAGGTLVIDRERTGDLRFPDLSLGEDRAFVASCHRRGISTFSADRFNFVQTRSVDNTWQVTTDAFVQQSIPVGRGLDLATVNR